MSALDRKEYLRQWRQANPEKVAAGVVRSQAKRKAKWGAFLERERARYQGVKDAVAERQKKRIKADPIKRADIVAASYRRNKASYVARVAKRRAAKLNATPPWADLDAIAKFYVLARTMTEETGVPHEVDHIFPLQGKTASGLHIPLNLRVIPRRENRAKGRKLGNDQPAQQLESATLPTSALGLS